MKIKSIFYVTLACIGLQAASTFAENQPVQGWGEWAYGQAAGAGQAVYRAGQYAGEMAQYLSPYMNRIRRGVNEQMYVLIEAAKREAGSLGERLVAAAKNEFAVMMPKIQDALVKGDYDAAEKAVMDAVTNLQKVGIEGRDRMSEQAQRELKRALFNIAHKVMTDTQKVITETQKVIPQK